MQSLYEPTNFEEAKVYAEIMAGSTAVADCYRGNKANVLMAMSMGSALGMGAAQSIQGIGIFGQRPAIWGDAMLAVVQAHQDCEGINEWMSEDGTIAYCEVQRKGQEKVQRSFSMQDASSAGLLNKKGPWQTYTRRMLQMRARAFALRDTFAYVLQGLQMIEEMQDIPPEENGPPAPTTEAMSATQKVAETLTNKVKPGPPAPAGTHSTDIPAADMGGDSVVVGDTPPPPPPPVNVTITGSHDLDGEYEMAVSEDGNEATITATGDESNDPDMVECDACQMLYYEGHGHECTRVAETAGEAPAPEQPVAESVCLDPNQVQFDESIHGKDVGGMPKLSPDGMYLKKTGSGIFDAACVEFDPNLHGQTKDKDPAVKMDGTFKAKRQRKIDEAEQPQDTAATSEAAPAVGSPPPPPEPVAQEAPAAKEPIYNVYDTGTTGGGGRWLTCGCGHQFWEQFVQDHVHGAGPIAPEGLREADFMAAGKSAFSTMVPVEDGAPPPDQEVDPGGAVEANTKVMNDVIAACNAATTMEELGAAVNGIGLLPEEYRADARRAWLAAKVRITGEH